MPKYEYIGSGHAQMRQFDTDLFLRLIDEPETVPDIQKKENAIAALESVIIYDVFDNPRDETRLYAVTYLERQMRKAKKETPDKTGIELFKEFLSTENALLELKKKSVFTDIHWSQDAHIKARVDARIAKNDAPEGATVEIDAEAFISRVQQFIKAENPDEIQEIFQQGQRKQAEAAPTTFYPKEFTISLAKAVTDLANVNAPITRDIQQATKFSVGGAVNVYVQLGFDTETAKENGIMIPSRIADFDLEVLNAIVSLLEAGNRLFWPEQIASVLKGKRAVETNTHETEIQRIVAAVERLRLTLVYIDATEQFANQRYKADPERIVEQKGGGHVVYDENILFLRGARLVNLKNGKTVRAWEYAGNRMPVLYEYSQQLKQITSVDISLLDTDTRSDAAITVAKMYMLREISKMKHGSRNNTKMLFSTIFKACGIDKPENDTEQAKNTCRTKKRRFRAYFTKFCDSWKARGFISDFTMLDDGIKIDV